MATISEKIQAGLDARVDAPIVRAAAALSIGYRTMLGLDGTSVEDAVEAAWTPSGPSREVLRARIEFRRANPGLLAPAAPVVVAA